MRRKPLLKSRHPIAKAIQDISFSLATGELLLIAGPSGCGKSTLLIQLHPRRIDLFLILTVLFLLVVVTVLNILGNFTLLPGIYFLHTQGIPPVLVAR